MATTKCLLYCTKAIKHYSVGYLMFNLDDLTLNPIKRFGHLTGRTWNDN